MKIILDKTIPMIYFDFKNIFKMFFSKYKVIVFSDSEIEQLRSVIKEYDNLKVKGGSTLRNLHLRN